MDPNLLPPLPESFTWSVRPVDAGRRLHLEVLRDHAECVACTYQTTDAQDWCVALFPHGQEMTLERCPDLAAACERVREWLRAEGLG